MSGTHLSDDCLIEMCMEGTVDTSSESHLRACEKCETRRVALASTLTEITAATEHEADELFPADRLARQHARIMQHIDRLGRPARVIAFPFTQPHGTTRPVGRHLPRWFAAAGAVAAAFVVGILAEHLVHELPGNFRGDTRLAVRAVDSGVPIRTVVASMSDDELLGQIELAVGSAGPAVLRPLDALTPRAWDVR